MKPLRWLSGLLRPAPSSPRRSRPSPLRLEALEDRTAPAAGFLDPTFNGGNVLLTPPSATTRSGADGVAVQHDGKIVVAGVTESKDGHDAIILRRWNADGTPDPTFGSRGVVTTHLGATTSVGGIALQKDGKIVVAGARSISLGGASEFVLMRFKANGALDRSFSGDGIATADLAGDDAAHAVALRPDGRIVVAGVSADHVAVLSFRADGTLDPTFGNRGVVSRSVESSDRADALAVQADGSVVVAGSTTDYTAHGRDFLLLRLRADGTPDPTFGDGGVVTTQFALPNRGSGVDEEAHALALQADGKIVVAGSIDRSSGPAIALARYQANGRLDPGFGHGGLVVIASGASLASANAVAVQSDGRIVVAGTCTTRFGSDDLAVARCSRTGIPDTGFGEGNGLVSFDLGGSDRADALALQPNGRIVVAGTTADVAGALGRLAGARLTVTPTDAAPVTTAPHAGQLYRNGQFVFQGASRIEVNDPDSGHADLRVSVRARHGVLKVLSAFTGGLTSLKGDLSATVTLVGPLDVLNECLTGLLFTADRGFVGKATVTVTTSDLGHFGTGGPRTDSATTALSVVDRAPVPVASTVVLVHVRRDFPDEAVAIANTCSPSRFYRDADGDPLSVKLVGRPAAGTLTFNNRTGLFRYTSTFGFSGKVKFRVEAFDGNRASKPITFILDIA